MLSFGLLAIVAYRSFLRQESAWDLLALVVLAGVASTAYQGLHKVLSRQWALITAATLLIAGLIAAAVVIRLSEPITIASPTRRVSTNMNMTVTPWV